MTEPPGLNPEVAVVGILLGEPRGIHDIDLDPRDFEDPRLGAIFHVMRELAAEQIPPSLIAVAERITRKTRGENPDQVLQHVTNTSLADLLTQAPLGATAGYYARLVSERATRRRLHSAATRIAQLAESSEDVDAAIEAARAEVDGVGGQIGEVDFVADNVDAIIGELETPPRFTPTPWPSLNDVLRGWRPGALYVVAARPGVGKTIMGVGAAIGMARHGLVAFSSLEMPRRELHHRILAALAQVDIGHLDDAGNITEEDWGKIAAQRQRLASLGISIDDRGDITATDVRSHARSVARRGALAGVIVDYLQLMPRPRGDQRPRHEVVADYSRRLKLLAKEMDVPVIALAQLNRASESRADKRPGLADIRESGAVEQDADVVILLHEDESDETKVSALVVKNRHGPRGAIELTRRGWYSRFDDDPWRSHAPAA